MLRELPKYDTDTKRATAAGKMVPNRGAWCRMAANLQFAKIAIFVKCSKVKSAHTEEIPWWVTWGREHARVTRGCKAAHEAGSGHWRGPSLC